MSIKRLNVAEPNTGGDEDEEQLIKVDAPDLEILSEELWHRVQQRLEVTRRSMPNH